MNRVKKASAGGKRRGLITDTASGNNNSRVQSSEVQGETLENDSQSSESPKKIRAAAGIPALCEKGWSRSHRSHVATHQNQTPRGGGGRWGTHVHPQQWERQKQTQWNEKVKLI